MAAPERQPISRSEQGGRGQVEQRPEQISLPERLEQDTGAQAVPAQPQAAQQQIQDSQQQAISDDQSAQTVVSVPYDQATLHDMAKGSPQDAKTWYGVFWDRYILGALRLGKRVVVGNN